MGDDIVKGSPVLIDFCDASMNQPDIGEPQVSDHPLSMGDWVSGQIDGQKLAFRQPPCHWHEISPIAAA